MACLQTDPMLGEVADNVKRQQELIDEAVSSDAHLVVLPECSTTGYCFDSQAEAAAVAEDVGARQGPAITMWSRACADHGIHIVGGLIERDGTVLYNTAVLVGPGGLIGKYRKTHLWGVDLDLYAPGDLGFPVFETPLGRVAMVICYDGWFPECARLEAVQGADVICIPANWVPVPTQDNSVPAMATMLCMTAAHTNLVYVAAASRVGVERGQTFIGRSIIVDHSGAPLAGPASGDREQIIHTRIAPIASRVERRSNPFNQPLRDRRTDLYDEMLGAARPSSP